MAELRLHYSAVSDVGRVRKDNQDSGYAGPWLLAVCDGVGGAARGDLASSTAIQRLRELDTRPAGDDLLALVADAMHGAHDRIRHLVAENPALSGTSTTATVALFDGQRLAVGHLGDSRAYLFRDGAISRLTNDHTFVQTLIDEGRITEDDARTHPNRNLILKAVDGVHESEPDLFYVALSRGDRVLLCSDGACSSLSDGRIADILSTGSPDFAAVELVRASLAAGSTDNVTCLVADAVNGKTKSGAEALIVGAAADPPLGTRLARATASRFRGHRAGDTGELDAVTASIPEDAGFVIDADPVDPEHARYAPQARPRYLWASRLLALTAVAGIIGMGVGITQWWIQRQYYVGEHDGAVTIFRGIEGKILGYELSRPYQTSNLTVSQLSDVNAESVNDGMEPGSLEDAVDTVENLHAEQVQPDSDGGAE